MPGFGRLLTGLPLQTCHPARGSRGGWHPANLDRLQSLTNGSFEPPEKMMIAQYVSSESARRDEREAVAAQPFIDPTSLPAATASARRDTFSRAKSSRQRVKIMRLFYGTSCSVVLNKKGPLNSVRSPAFFPATGCKRADKGLFHFHASDATSPKMRIS
jgi:hypothetical protein